MRTVHLPCGFIAEDGVLYPYAVLRPTTGEEDDMFTDEDLAEAGTTVREVVLTCLQELRTSRNGDAAVIVDRGELRTAMQALLLNDKKYLYVQLRRISVYPDGDLYRFAVSCKGAGCKKLIHANHGLSDEDLQVKHMEEPRTRVWEEELPVSKKIARFRLLTVADMPKMQALITEKKKALMTMTVWMHLVSVDGQPVSSPLDVKKFSSADLDFLRQKFDEVGGGIDTAMLLKCPHCRRENKVQIPVEDPSFFFPSGMATSS